jgi:peptidoglycan/xylan/chitin deacetylase (PgdA/CDA1 family)
MIGVIVDPAEHDVVREFFELFKTPWEFSRGDSQYDVLLCTGEVPDDTTAKLIIVYAGRRAQFDNYPTSATTAQSKDGCFLSYQGTQIPIYGNFTTFQSEGTALLSEESSRECAAYLLESDKRVLARIGYDLFGEIRTLLTVGQPPVNASIPTLEMHIAILRDLIVSCGFPLAEIPPIPDGYRFVVCLTHDVDHPSIRLHKFDHTTIGFLFRALFVSVIDTLLGRMPVRDVIRNWIAAFKLPFVHLGLARDFWRDFDDRYLELEKDLPSTFFVIPRKNYSGKRDNGPAPASRASRYEANDIADAIRKLRSAGCEVGLHGIDAWLATSTGHDEFEEVRRLSGASEIGVRMHWLYYNEKSPAALEQAKAAYDSTSGYNETVGFRAGTTQVYKPLEAKQLLELPLHAMDTSLFYLSYLGLSPRRAAFRLKQMADCVAKFGGCLTVNWHDRSLAPERLWVGCYRDLIQELRSQGAWFATAGQAVSWFRKRRSVTFETDFAKSPAVGVKLSVNREENLPPLRLRIYQPAERGTNCPTTFVDLAVEKGLATLDSSKLGLSIPSDQKPNELGCEINRQRQSELAR